MVIIPEMEKLKRRSDIIRDNIRTDMNDVVDSKLNVDSSDYKKNSILSEITNSHRVITELL